MNKVSLYNFNEKFLGVVYFLNGLKYRYKIIHYDSKLNCLISVFLKIITTSMY